MPCICPVEESETQTPRRKEFVDGWVAKVDNFFLRFGGFAKVDNRFG
jgi:hypothetical protein